MLQRGASGEGPSTLNVHYTLRKYDACQVCGIKEGFFTNLFYTRKILKLLERGYLSIGFKHLPYIGYCCRLCHREFSVAILIPVCHCHTDGLYGWVGKGDVLKLVDEDGISVVGTLQFIYSIITIIYTKIRGNILSVAIYMYCFACYRRYYQLLFDVHALTTNLSLSKSIEFQIVCCASLIDVKPSVNLTIFAIKSHPTLTSHSHKVQSSSINRLWSHIYRQDIVGNAPAHIIPTIDDKRIAAIGILRHRSFFHCEGCLP